MNKRDRAATRQTANSAGWWTHPQLDVAVVEHAVLEADPGGHLLRLWLFCFVLVEWLS